MLRCCGAPVLQTTGAGQLTLPSGGGGTREPGLRAILTLSALNGPGSLLRIVISSIHARYIQKLFYFTLIALQQATQLCLPNYEGGPATILQPVHRMQRCVCRVWQKWVNKASKGSESQNHLVLLVRTALVKPSWPLTTVG